MNDDVVYVIMCCEVSGEAWIISVCRESLTADEACAKLNADKESPYMEYYIEEHEVY